MTGGWGAAYGFDEYLGDLLAIHRLTGTDLARRITCAPSLVNKWLNRNEPDRVPNLDSPWISLIVSTLELSRVEHDDLLLAQKVSLLRALLRKELKLDIPDIERAVQFLWNMERERIIHRRLCERHGELLPAWTVCSYCLHEGRLSRLIYSDEPRGRVCPDHGELAPTWAACPSCVRNLMSLYAPAMTPADGALALPVPHRRVPAKR